MKNILPPLRQRTVPVAALVLGALALVAGCGGGGSPAPLSGILPAPGLGGRTLLVFPVQQVAVPGDADRELAFALQARRGAATWVLPEALRASLERSPQLHVPLDALPVGNFLRAEVRRVGDPLYGMIRRAASLTDAEMALLPVGVAYRPGSDGNGGALELLAAVVDVTSGRVLWLDRVEAPADTPDDPGGMPRVMDALANAILAGG